MAEDECPKCGGPSRHTGPGECVKYLAAIVRSQTEVLSNHTGFMQEDRRLADTAHHRLDTLDEIYRALASKQAEQIKWLNELASKLTVHEAKHGTDQAQGAREDELFKARREGYSAGFRDMQKRMGKLMKEVLGDDYSKSGPVGEGGYSAAGDRERQEPDAYTTG